MADSLIDFGQMAQNLQGFERNRIYEQNSLQQTEQNRLQGVQLKQNQDRMRLDGLVRLKDDPTVKASQELGDRVLMEIVGVAAPELKDQALTLIQKGRASMWKAVQGMQSGDADRTALGILEVATTLSPDDAKKLEESVLTIPKMAEAMKTLRSRNALNEARTEDLHNKTAEVEAGHFKYGQAVRDFALPLSQTEDPKFIRALKSAHVLGQEKSELSRDTLLAGPLSFYNSQDWTVRVQQMEMRATEYATQARQAQENLILLEKGTPSPDGKTKRELEHIITANQDLSDGYMEFVKWGDHPLNSEALGAARRAQRTIEARKKELDTLNQSTSAKRAEIASDALTRNLDNDERKRLAEQSIKKASTAALKRFGYTPTSSQLAEVASEFQVNPKDIIVGDPAKAHTQKVEISNVTGPLGGHDEEVQHKAISAGEDVIRYTDRMAALIEKNPKIIGGGASIGTSVAGLVQQMRAATGLSPVGMLGELSRADPDGAKFINTKTRDQLVALNELMVYKMAKTLDQSGALDINVVKHARESLGDVSSWFTGPQQVVNRLRESSDVARETIFIARRRLLEGKKSYLTDSSIPVIPGVVGGGLQHLSDAEIDAEIAIRQR